MATVTQSQPKTTATASQPKTTANTTDGMTKVGRFEIRYDADFDNYDIIDTRDDSAPGYGSTLAEAKQIARGMELEAIKEELIEKIEGELVDLSVAKLRKIVEMIG